jgi:hypothetical protein
LKRKSDGRYNGGKFRDSTIANDEELSAVVNLMALGRFKDNFTFSWDG